MIVAPCRDCSNKGCGAYHDECKQYQEFRAEVEKITDQKQKRAVAQYGSIKEARLKTTRRKREGLR